MADEQRVEILPPGPGDPDLTSIEGPLRDAVVAAAEYATDAIAEPTRKAHLRDWAEFSRWCRENGADPAGLPINPVVVAAWLGRRTCAGWTGKRR